MYLITDYQQVAENDRPTFLTAFKAYEAKQVGYVDGLYYIKDDTGYEITVPINRPSLFLNNVGVFKLFAEVNS